MSTSLQLDAPALAAPPRPWQLTPNASLALLILVSTLLRLAWSAGMGVCNDEAYHYLFTVYPDWSYFDHPPMTMWIEWLGITVCGGWVHPLSLRLGFVVMVACSTWVMARLTTRWYGAWAGFYAALTLNLTIYYGAAGGFALPDPPLLFFGLLTITALANALIAERSRTLPWVWVGLAFAGTLASKYHAIFLPMGAFLYICLTPSARPILRRPGPYLALAIGSIGFAPVLIWNAKHEWLSFVFQGSRAVGMEFHVAGLVTTLLGPIIYLFPWNWYLIVSLLFRRLWNFRAVQGIDRLLVCLAVVPIGVFLAISCMKPMLPHWSLLGFVAMFPMAGARWAERAAANPAGMRRSVAFLTAVMVTIGVLAILQCQLGLIHFSGRDPLVEASGWDSVADELKARGLVGETRTFLFTDRWYDSGQLAFALRETTSSVPVLCYNRGDAHGFGQWHHPDDWIGWNGVFVSTRECPKEIETLKHYFEKAEFVVEFSMTRGGTPFRTVNVWRFTNQRKPFPFAYGARP